MVTKSSGTIISTTNTTTANRQHHHMAGSAPRSSHSHSRPVINSVNSASSQATAQINKKKDKIKDKDKDKVVRLPVATTAATPTRPLTKTATTTTATAIATEKCSRLIPSQQVSSPTVIVDKNNGSGDCAGCVDSVVFDINGDRLTNNNTNSSSNSRIDGDGNVDGDLNHYDGSSSFAYEGSNGSCYVSMSMTFNTTQVG